MLFLLDSNAISDLMREDPRVLGRLGSLTALDRIVTCTIAKGEIHEIQYGIDHLPEGKRRTELEAKAKKLFAVLPCEPVLEAAADHYARIKLTRERKGLALDENDIWIAATAMGLGAELVSRDRDFGGIDGLQVNDWTK